MGWISAVIRFELTRIGLKEEAEEEEEEEEEKWLKLIAACPVGKQRQRIGETRVELDSMEGLRPAEFRTEIPPRFVPHFFFSFNFIQNIQYLLPLLLHRPLLLHLLAFYNRITIRCIYVQRLTFNSIGHFPSHSIAMPLNKHRNNIALIALDLIWFRIQQLGEMEAESGNVKVDQRQWEQIATRLCYTLERFSNRLSRWG